MPFGLTNGTKTLCNLMNDVFNDFLNKFAVVYLDDILICSESSEDHLSHLELGFSRMKENQLYVEKEKCEFACTEIMFLRHRHRVSKGNV